MRYRAALPALVLLACATCGPEQRVGEPSPPGAEQEASMPADPAATAVEMAATGSTGWSLPEPEQSYNVRQGRALFRHYCATCHGEEGRGDGFNAYNLDPKPRDLGEAAFQAQRSDSDFVSVIQSGGGVSGLSTAMPPWGRTLSRRDIHNLVAFIRVLPSEAK